MADSPSQLTPGRVRSLSSSDLIGCEDLAVVTDLFLQSFPSLVRERFPQPDAARRFYFDLFRLIAGLTPTTAFAERRHGDLRGFLFLTPPRLLTVGRLLTSPLAWTLACRASAGRYGSPIRVLRGLGARAAGLPGAEERRLDSEAACVYAVAVAPTDTGQGIGTALLNRAKAWCRSRRLNLWLHVECSNQGAVRFYEHAEFVLRSRGPRWCVMEWTVE